MAIEQTAGVVFQRFGLPVLFTNGSRQRQLSCLLRISSNSSQEGYRHTVIGWEEPGASGVWRCVFPWWEELSTGEWQATWREQEFTVSQVQGKIPLEEGFLYGCCTLTPITGKE